MVQTPPKWPETQFVEGKASPMGFAEPNDTAAGKLQAVSAVGHVENGAESQCPKQDLKTFGCYSRGTMTGRLPKGYLEQNVLLRCALRG